MYKLLRNILFCFDAERVHYFSMNSLQLICCVPIFKNLLQKIFLPKQLEKQIWNLSFRNPVGLGAGFDKNAKYLRELSVLGFGFVEIGTVTPLAQPGNARPRLFRLPKDKAIINRMGFNNDGTEIIAQRLKAFRQHNQTLIIGGNIGKNKNTPNEDAWKDYEISFIALHDYVDYFVVNVSSPNTPGLRELQHKNYLKTILENLQQINATKKIKRPVLLKISPDLSKDELDEIIDLVMEIKLDGIVATNTTVSRNNLSSSKNNIEKIGTGGLSGKPLAKTSTDITRYIFEKTNGNITIIGSGGIFTSADASEKLKSGAALIEVWTGFIYEGPAVVKKICKGL